MKLVKQDFNHRVYEEKTITLHPNNTAIYNNTKYKIKPVSPQDEYVVMEEIKEEEC